MDQIIVPGQDKVKIMHKEEIVSYKETAQLYLIQKLLPFWVDRLLDKRNGGYITHFDANGNDTGKDSKSLIAQTRSVYTMASAHRAGYGGGDCAEVAKYGVDFLVNTMWDKDNGGFYWMVDRKGNVVNANKILYGHSFAMYCLSEYTLATGDKRGIEYAEKTFQLIQKHCYEPEFEGFHQMHMYI